MKRKGTSKRSQEVKMERRKQRKKEKKKIRDSLDLGGSALSHFERDFLKF